jgi:hypothetical protein
MSDMPSYDRNKAAMRQKETPLNTGPAQVPCSPRQGKNVSKYTSKSGHPYGDRK